MNKEIINLDVNYGKGCVKKGVPTLSAVTAPIFDEIGRQRKQAVIICPGGAYKCLSDREAEPVGVRFMAYGINAFILRYNVDVPFPTALYEVEAAFRYVKENADKYDIDPEKISIMGFSAGAHLAACYANFWKKMFVSAVKPYKCVLSYPVISGISHPNEDSFNHLIGENASVEELTAVSMEKNVSEDTPPTFIWHNADDDIVPVENTLEYCTALSRNKVPFECHIYPEGNHGVALADWTSSRFDYQVNEVCAQWAAEAIRFIQA